MCSWLSSSIRFISGRSLNVWFRSTKKESHSVLLASRVLLNVLFRFTILSNAFYRVQCNEPFCWNFNCFDFSTACPVLWPKCTPLCCFECCCSCQQIKRRNRCWHFLVVPREYFQFLWQKKGVCLWIFSFFECKHQNSILPLLNTQKRVQVSCFGTL